MSLTESETLKLLHGDPLVFKDICIVKSPLLGEIASIGLDKFYTYISILLTTKPAAEDAEMKKLLNKISDFEYLLILAESDGNFKQQLMEAFKLFTGEKPLIILDPPQLVLGPLTEKRMLEQYSFHNFQNYIRDINAMSDGEQDIEFLDSDSERVRALKEQLLEGRKKRAAAKAKKESKDGVKFPDLVASVAVGCEGLNINNIWNLTYYAFQDQLKRMSWREEFDINSRAAMAGAKIGKDKLSHWIKSM